MAKNSNETKSMSPNVKLSIIGFGLVILFVLMFKYTGVQSESPSVHVAQTDDSTSIPVNNIATDKISAVSDFNNPVVQISTDLGDLKIELYPDYAPTIVNELIKLISENYYDEKTVLESKPGVGFVIAKVGADAHQYNIVNDEVNNLRSERGSVAIMKHGVSPAYLNNIFVGYKSQLELQEMYIIIGQVLEGVDDIEKNSNGIVGSVSSVSVNERQAAVAW